MSDDITLLTDHQGRKIRLTAERRTHILEHPEMTDQFERIQETLQKPTLIVATHADENRSCLSSSLLHDPRH